MSAALETGQAQRQRASCPPGRPQPQRRRSSGPFISVSIKDFKKEKKQHPAQTRAIEAVHHSSPLTGRVCNLMHW